jgi:hypothetical protein
VTAGYRCYQKRVPRNCNLANATFRLINCELCNLLLALLQEVQSVCILEASAHELYGRMGHPPDCARYISMRKVWSELPMWAKVFAQRWDESRSSTGAGRNRFSAPASVRSVPSLPSAIIPPAKQHHPQATAVIKVSKIAPRSSLKICQALLSPQTPTLRINHDVAAF